MPYKFERLYGVPATCNFVLWETDGIDINATASAVLGDVTYFQNFTDACANSTNLFSAHTSGLGHQLIVSTAEMETSKIFIKISDTHNSPKEWLDEIIIIETYGNENSQHNRRESGVILETVIASASGNAEFFIVDKPNDNNTLLNSVAMIIDNSGPNSPPDRSFRNVTSYTGSTGRIELESDIDFTMTSGDRVTFLPASVVDSADDIASAVWDVARADHTTAGTFGQGVNLGEFNASGKANVSGIFVSALTDQNIMSTDDLPSNFGGMAITGGGAVTVGTNNDKTDYTLAAGEATALSEVFLTFSWSAITTSAGSRSTLNALRFLRNKWEVSGSSITIFKENDVSAAWTSDLSTVASANSIITFTPEN
jgi:hypothetical protein